MTWPGIPTMVNRILYKKNDSAFAIFPMPMPHAPCPMPHAPCPCPMLHALCPMHPDEVTFIIINLTYLNNESKATLKFSIVC